jgi:hypothetical protein
MPGEKDDNEEFDRLETVEYDEDDLPHEQHHTSEVDALLLTPLSDEATRELIEDEEQTE